MSPAIGASLSHFTIIAKLGEGGMGEVWRAEDTKLGREVALKVLPEAFTRDPERLARFEREARVLAALDHPNIASIYSFETVDPGREGEAETPLSFLVMQLAEGETLQERIARGAMSAEEAGAIARQIVIALEAAHEQGIIHRDLKPANVKIAPDGSVKVLDFGLAKALEGDPASSPTQQALTQSPTLTAQMTGAGVLLGTAAYMSPEQARGQVADKRADIWAFGIVLMEMLTGRMVYAGETVSDTLAGVLAREPEWEALPRATPRALRRLLDRCLAKDVKQRLRDIGEARIALDRYLAAPQAEEEPDSAVSEMAQPVPAWRRWLPWAVAAALGLAVVGMAVWAPGRGGAEQRLLRATVLPPSGSSWYLDGTFPGPVVVSPDGRQVAFTARAEGETEPVLWLRPLDSPVGRPLAGTEGASYPFWSPDARYLAFYAGGNLKKVALGGGPPVTLCKAPFGKSGAWSRDGMIVFTPDSGAPLSRVAAAGGDCTPLTQLSEEVGDNSHRHPRFLPDGQHFLYLARRSTSEGSMLRIGSVDGSASRDLVASPAQGEYASGRLLFLRETTLMAQSFDPDRLELSGEAVPLIENVLIIPGAALAVYSASENGVLVHQSGRAFTKSQLEWFDRSGKEIEPVGDPADQLMISLSPDARKAAVVVADEDGIGDIWIDDLQRGVRSRFTFDPAADVAPVWSPSGERIVFASNRGEGGSFDLYTKEVGGSGGEELVLTSEGSTFPWSWSPDGRYVLYSEQMSGQSDVWALEIDGDRQPMPLVQTEFWESNPMISPDGRWLAYGSNETGREQIYVTTFPQPGRKWQVSIESGDQPRWLGDGREIVFLSEDWTRIRAASVAAAGDTFEVGAVEELFAVNLRGDAGADWDVSRDGQRFLVNSGMDPDEVSALNLTVNWPLLLAQD